MSTPAFPDDLAAPKAEPAAKPAAPKIIADGTAYVVLREVTPNDADWRGWRQEALLGTIIASSTHDAVRKASQGKAGTYVAIPHRSFKPVTVKVETVTRVTLGDA